MSFDGLVITPVSAHLRGWSWFAADGTRPNEADRSW
jgi:hypothetical protein